LPDVRELTSLAPLLLIVSCTAAPTAATPQPSATASAPLVIATGASASAAPIGTAKLAVGAQLRTISFIDERTGWAAGDTPDGKAFLVRTTDGGRTWNALPAPSVYLATGGELLFVDTQHGWLRASVLLPGNTAGCSPPSTAPPQCRSVILHTNDGGNTWEEQLTLDQPSKLGSGLRALNALDDRHAWAIALKVGTTDPSACTPFDCAIAVVGTTDGVSWTGLGDLPAFGDGLDFVDAQTGFGSVHTAKNEPGTPTNTASIVATRDGGKTWAVQLHVDGKAPRFFVDFIDARSGFALQQDLATCGGSDCWLYSFYRTTDGGQTWDKVQQAPQATAGAWWSPRGSLAALESPIFASPFAGWIPISRDAGPDLSGGVLATTDGGRSWKRSPSAPEGWETRDLASRGTISWVVGQRASDQSSFIARTDNAGQSWDYQLLAQR